MKTVPSLLCDLLEALGVSHTTTYTNSRYTGMPFRSLFGLKKLLQEYGIDSEALAFSGKRLPDDIEVPFLAGAGGRWVVVTAVSAAKIDYLDAGIVHTLPRRRFDNLFSGTVMLLYPEDNASEPSYRLHRDIELAQSSKVWVMSAAITIVIAYFFISNGVWRHISTVLLTLLNLAGMAVALLLVRKQLGIKDKAAERVCGVLKAGGCDDIMASPASKFFGLFGWSEVGMAYFSVSLATLLLFPGQWGHLALINACCLPYTVWSIWYQRFRARTWCTLCVTVQSILWLQFLCFLLGGLWHGAAGRWLSLAVLASTYAGALLAINAVNTLKTVSATNHPYEKNPT